MNRIEIHSRRPDGEIGRLNSFEGDNAQVTSTTGDERHRAYLILRRRAEIMVHRWRDTLPGWKIEMRETKLW